MMVELGAPKAATDASSVFPLLVLVDFHARTSNAIKQQLLPGD
jgi:hypothetical protein